MYLPTNDQAHHLQEQRHGITRTLLVVALIFSGFHFLDVGILSFLNRCLVNPRQGVYDGYHL